MTNIGDGDPILQALERWARAADDGRQEDALRIAQETAELGRRSNNAVLRAAAELPLEATRREMAGLPPPTPACTFCGAEEGSTVRIVAGPNVFICSGCIAACRDTLDEYAVDQDKSGPKWHTPAGLEAARCSFCGRPPSDVKTLIAKETGAICDTCVALCHGIVFGGAP